MSNPIQQQLTEFFGPPPRRLGDPITPRMLKSMNEASCLGVIRDLLKLPVSGATKEFARDAFPVAAVLVMANTTLYDPDGDPLSFAAIIWDADGELDHEALSDVVMEINELDEVRLRDIDDREVRALAKAQQDQTLPDDVFLHVPEHMADAPEVYYSAITIERDWLPGKTLDSDWTVPCLVTFDPNRIHACPSSWFIGCEVAARGSLRGTGMWGLTARRMNARVAGATGRRRTPLQEQAWR
jgi:hypothetical protein